METVTIPKTEYEELVRDQEFLRNLEAAGVDNWEGYEYGFGDDSEDFDKLDDEDLDDDPEELPTP
jgi:hypothetical protein